MMKKTYILPSSPAGLFMTGILVPIIGGALFAIVSHLPVGGLLAAFSLWLAILITALIIILIAIHISAIRAAEQKLKQSHDELHAVVSSIGEGLLVINADERITTANAAALQILGFPEEKELRSIRNAFALCKNGTPLEYALFPPIMALSQKEPVRTILYDNVSIVTHKGSTPIVGTANPLIDSNGACLGAVWIFRDVSREKKIDEHKTEFVALASHQLKTPLTIINWYSELLIAKGRAALKKNLLSYAKHISRGGNRMADLINELITIAHIEEGTIDLRLSPIDAAAALSSVIEECAPLLAKDRGKVDFSPPKRPCFILGDPVLFYQSLLNIIVNAIRYSKPKQCAISIRVLCNAGSCRISISDTGIGIPEEAQEHIFEKFFRARNAIDLQADGNGLGLYISKRFIDLMGGSLRFESREKRGTTFHLSLPLAQ